MEVIPSIDLKDGRCVRLFQGDYRQETVYSDDPLPVALGWQEQGAPRLHLVDLDGAAPPDLKTRPANRAIINAIVDRLAIPVQVGGGIRDAETALDLLAAGVDRVVIGTAAIERPQMVSDLCQQQSGDKIVVAVDARDGKVAVRGWTETTQVSVLDLAAKMATLGVRRLLYTDISRDGALTGPNVAANATLVRETGLAVQASGGIASLEHIAQLKETGVEAAILGRSLYTGAVNLPAAIALAQP